MCRFEGANGSLSYELEFIGYGEVAVIQYSAARGPRSLPAGSYEVLEFDERSRKIHLVFRNPGDPTLLPSFTLKGEGNQVLMSIDGKKISGELRCDF
jgi:hypothetical protein